MKNECLPIRDKNETVTITFHNNITSYVSAKIHNEFIHIDGLIVVKAEIPDLTQIITLSKGVKGGNFPLINISGGKNHSVSISNTAGNLHQGNLTTGTYQLDSWLLLI